MAVDTIAAVGEWVIAFVIYLEFEASVLSQSSSNHSGAQVSRKVAELAKKSFAVLAGFARGGSGITKRIYDSEH